MPVSPWILQRESRYLSQVCDITRSKCLHLGDFIIVEYVS